MIKTLKMDGINQIIWYLTLHIPYIIISTRGHYKNVSEIFYVLFKNLPFHASQNGCDPKVYKQ